MACKLFLIILVLGAVQAELNWLVDFWKPVMLFPKVDDLSDCNQELFIFGTSGKQCSCADNTTAFQSGALALDKESFGHYKIFPIIEASGTIPSPEIPCECGKKRYKDRMVVQRVNRNYIITYLRPDRGSKLFSEKEPDRAFLMATKYENEKDIRAVVERVKELKSRKGQLLCSKELSENNNKK